MKIKLGYVKVLYDTELIKKIKAVTSLTSAKKWSLLKLVKKIEAEFTDLEEVRVELVKKYGEKADGDNYKVEGENLNKFITEFNEVLDKEIEVPEFKFTETEVDDFSVEDLMILERYFLEGL